MNRLVVTDVLDRVPRACTADTCLSEWCEDRRFVMCCLLFSSTASGVSVRVRTENISTNEARVKHLLVNQLSHASSSPKMHVLAPNTHAMHCMMNPIRPGCRRDHIGRILFNH